MGSGENAGGGGTLGAAAEGAWILGPAGTIGSGGEDAHCGTREGLAGGVASASVRSSIGAAFRLVNPNSWDKAPMPARNSSTTVGVRARRAGAGDFGVADADESGVDDGCVGWLTAGLDGGSVSADGDTGGEDGSVRGASAGGGIGCATIAAVGAGASSTRAATPGDAAGAALEFEPAIVGDARGASVAKRVGGVFADAAGGGERAPDTGGDFAGERLLAVRAVSPGGDPALELALEPGSRDGASGLGLAKVATASSDSGFGFAVESIALPPDTVDGEAAAGSDGVLAEGGFGSSAATALASDCAADVGPVAVSVAVSSS